MMRRTRPTRPSAPRTEPRIIGARRLDLLKPVDCGCWSVAFVLVGDNETVGAADEIAKLEEVDRVVVVGVILEVKRGVCTLC